MQVSEVMHQGVTTANINDSIKRVATIMKEEDIGSLPVMEDGRTVGFVTDRDIVVSCVANGSSLDESISRAMTEDIITITEDKDISEAAKLMQKNKISRLVVVDQSQKPIGVLSLQDISENLEDEIFTGETLEKIKEH